MPTYDEYKAALEAEPKEYDLEDLFIGEDKEFVIGRDCIRVTYSFEFDDRKWTGSFTSSLDVEGTGPKHIREFTDLTVKYEKIGLVQDKEEGIGLYALTT